MEYWCKSHGVVQTDFEGVCPRCEGVQVMRALASIHEGEKMNSALMAACMAKAFGWAQVIIILGCIAFGVWLGSFL